MKTKLVVIFATVLMLVSAIGYFGIKWSYENDEMRIRHNVEAHIEASKSHYSKMKEIIFGDAQVANKYDESFKEVYPQMISGRYNKGGGQLMQWVQESNPNYSTALLEKVQRAIEAQRESFHQNQVQLLDVKRRHDNLLDSKPFGTFFLSDREKIDVPVIITDEAQKVFETGREESNQKLF